MGDFHVKKIILPSGKAVEIVYFHQEPGAEVEATTTTTTGEEPLGLELCPDCGSDQVYPTDWREAEGDRWELERRCPNCEWTERAEHDQDTVERYDTVLNGGTDALIETLERVTRENMEAEIERFVAALENGRIEPFASSRLARSRGAVRRTGAAQPRAALLATLMARDRRDALGTVPHPRLLGRGGMSSVWLAHDGVLLREVAVKLLHAAPRPAPEALERFEREARTLAALTHPGIVTVIDRGEDKGRPYIVFEYVHGEDLRTVLDRGPLPLAQALAVTAQIAEALGYAHAHGVIHRDVKPHNVLLGEDGRVKLTDFGIARVLEEPGLTATGRVLGTGQYIAPEQALGGAVDARSDVYGLGALLYHCLTGAPPYTGDSVVAVAQQHVHAPVPSVCRLYPELPVEVDRIVARAMAKEPEDRYPSCSALAVDLEDMLARGADDAGDDTAEVPLVVQALRPVDETDRQPRPRQVRRSDVRGPLLLAGVLAVALAAALWIGGVFDRSEIAPTRRRRRLRRTRRPSLRRQPRLSCSGPLAALDYDPLGDSEENSGSVGLAVDGEPSTVWSTGALLRQPPRPQRQGRRRPRARPRRPRAGAQPALADADAGLWQARMYSSGESTPPDSLDGWKAASAPFSVDDDQARIALDGPPARLYLLWITSLAGQPESYSVGLGGVELLGQKR